MHYIKNHLLDNSGDESVSKLIWIVICFVLGTILINLFNPYENRIFEWIKKRFDNWFSAPVEIS